MTLVLLCLAAGFALAYVASLVTGATLLVARRQLRCCAASAQARVYLVAAYTPVFIASAAMFAALAPSFGWVADHCMSQHGHPHICVAHHVREWPQVSLLVLVLLGVSRCAWTFVERGRALWVANKLNRSLAKVSQADETSGALVVPADGGNAFVLGLWRPTLYTTRGLWHGPDTVYRDVVLAHEQAHLLRRDGLHRFFAGLCLCAHLPGISTWLAQRLAEAQEMAADDAAAAAVGDRILVADALVALARSTSRVPLATAFSQSNLVARVHHLLSPPKERQLLKPESVALGAFVSLLGVAGSAEAIHHGVEIMLGVLGGE